MQGMGEQCVRTDMMVPTDHSNLSLWYPNGYGAPSLYLFEATINAHKVSILHMCTVYMVLLG